MPTTDIQYPRRAAPLSDAELASRAVLVLEQHHKFIWRMTAARNVPITARVVGNALLCRFYDPETGQCNPSIDDVAKATGISPRAAFTAIAQLRDAGWITVKSPRTVLKTPRTRLSHTNQYGFNFQQGEPASPAARVPA